MGDEIIVAIDFGTAYSGYAFLISGKDPILPQWGKEEGQSTSKTPTCILFDRNEEFLKFGYEAKREYTRSGNEKAKKTLLFENFKMELYRKKLNKGLMITAVNGKKMSSLKVITESLRYLKDHALKTIAENTRGQTFTASDFTWVLTVPAIWDASAKQFMRKAATEADIVNKSQPDKLVIALESEAASIWCKQLPSDGFIDDNTSFYHNNTLEQRPGTQYIVADCGGILCCDIDVEGCHQNSPPGNMDTHYKCATDLHFCKIHNSKCGTIDITVHEVCAGGFLKELHKASGNDMGGEQVTKNFKGFLKEIFSDDLWNDYERKFPSEVQQLMYNFSVLKSVDDDVEFFCPYNLAELAQKNKPIENHFNDVQGVSWDEGVIQISKAKMRSFFDESLSAITKCLDEILKKDLSIEYLVLVGGFASSKILHTHITKQFGAQCKVISPALAEQAILKGAVMFGRNPALVASRKSAFTYGINASMRFDKRFTSVKGKRSHDLFKKLVTIDEDVGWDETRDHIIHVPSKHQTHVRFKFYRTERKNPDYVDDWEVEKLNSIEFKMPDTTCGQDREIHFQVKFGATEITASATDVNSKSTKPVKINFMSK